MTAEISAVGAYVPEKRVSNEELAKTIDTSDEWIRSHTGIGNRHISSPDEASSDLGVKASLLALERAGMEPAELDMIICSTATPDYPGFPATASIIEDNPHHATTDSHAACCGCVDRRARPAGRLRPGRSQDREKDYRRERSVDRTDARCRLAP